MSNIVIYLPNEPLGKQGGMERATHRLAAMLAGEGHRVTLLCRNKNRLGEEYVPPTDLVFIPASLRREEEQDFLLNLIKERGIETIIDQTEGGIVGRWGIFRRRGHMNGVSVKLIAVQHSSQYTYLKHYRTVNRKPAERGLIGKTRSFFYNTFFLALKKCRTVLLQRSLFRELASDYDQIVTLSEGGIEEFKKLCPSVPGNKLSCIPNIVEPPSLPREEKKEPRCLFVGRLDNPSKGVDRLLRIWEKVEKACPDWHLDIVGDGPDAELLKDSAQKLGLSRIAFHGFQNPEPYYSRASVFCMTSTFEGFGLVLVEAMQHGCVPIAFDSYPAVRDIISHGENGILIPPFQEEDYSNAIMALTNNPDEMKRFSLHSLSISQKFSPANLASRWNAIL